MRLAAGLRELAENASFAYATIILLQVKVMFGVWQYRDLTRGDTAYYFRNAIRWAEDLQVHIAWSPLYTSFMGTLHAVLENAFHTAVVSRLCIAVLATVLVLALLRRLLPRPLAWCIAAWWAVLPITFDTVYTVHLFGALLPLAVFVALAHVPAIYGRGLATGLLIVTTFLVRNEFLLVTLLWAIIVLGYEWKQHSKGRGARPGQLIRAYGIPMLVAFLLLGWYYSRSYVQYPTLSRGLDRKHTLNVCQIYAFNRIQQGDSWKGSPWEDCQEIMQRDFGVPEPSFLGAFLQNPNAILSHVWWNASLIPGGTQLALFNRYGGGANPDYLLAKKSKWVWLPSVALVAVIGLGLYRLWRKRDYWWQAVFAETVFVWLAMACSAAVVFVVMLMQRPRPSYMFTYTFFLMALAGLSGHVLLRKTAFARAGSCVMPLVALLALVVVPPHYTPQYKNAYAPIEQPLRHAYERLWPFVRGAADDDQTVVLARHSAQFLCWYLIHPCRGLDYGDTLDAKPAELSYPAYMRELGVDWLYLDPVLLRAPATQAVRDDLLQNGWSRVGSGVGPDGQWITLATRSALTSSR